MKDPTDALIRAMQRSDFYPHPVTLPIRLVQTHISYVLLTGNFAYKVKKPVTFNFLDFSTLGKRKHYCEEELRLNRVCAPELYLCVVPIGRANGEFALGLEGIVEYAVKMRQFDDADLLSNVFERNALTEAHVGEMACTLADFHARADTNETIARYGETTWILNAIRNNQAVERTFLNITQTADRYEAVKAFMEGFVARHEPLFRERIAEGRIRECHGDLHLNNICIYDGRIRFFDRIEFSESLKNIDVIYDAAFLVMDLAFRGRPDFANRLLNEYLELTGDYRAALLLPLYLSERAAVRGKVSSLQSADMHLDPAQRQLLREQADSYFELAYRYTRPRRGRLYATCGISGAGKSSVARMLAAKTNAVILRSDALRKHLAGVPLHKTTHGLYSPESTKHTYARLVGLGVELAAHGVTVILDATFGRREQRERLVELAKEHDIPVQFLWCKTDTATARARLSSRAWDVSDADEHVVAAQAASFDDFDSNAGIDLTIVPTTSREVVLEIIGNLAPNSEEL